ncbi:MAG: WD40/YVTN/BNR-like repeat-containing protein [Candidatus Promineifilaceae bacterium]
MMMLPAVGLAAQPLTPEQQAALMSRQAENNLGQDWQLRHTLPNGLNLLSVTCPAAEICVAVGQGGTLLKSIDGGTTWNSVSSNTSQQLNGVSCELSTCIAVGEAGTVLRSTDDGTTWDAIYSGTSRSLLGVECGDNACIIVGQSGTVLRSTNNGANWSSAYSATSQLLYGVECGASACIIVGQSGTVLRSTNNGASWSSVYSGTSRSLYGIDCGISTCIAVGLSGTIMRSTNSGASWSAVSSGVSGFLQGVDCRDEICIAVGQSGTILRSIDGGVSWTPAVSGSSQHLYDISCGADDTCVTVGGSGTILQSGGEDGPEFLGIYMLAFDGEVNSANSLSSYLIPTIDGLVNRSSSEGDHKAAIVLADGSGAGNTHILMIRNGNVEVIEGLPNDAGELQADLREYDMADGEQLGNFLSWARAQYPTVAKTTLSYVGHGTYLMPETDIANLQAPASDVREANSVVTLPSFWASSPHYTDHSPEGMISPYDLAVALDKGTDSGANPIQVLDLTHCFSASIEEFYELSDLRDGQTQPYAEIMVGSPNYVYFAPDMLGDAFAAFDTSDDSTALANQLIDTYDGILVDADDSDNEDDFVHPRILVAVDSARVPQLKQALDEVAYWIARDWDRDKLLASYEDAAKYDTDFCEPDGQLSSPDALVDVRAFMQSLLMNYSYTSWGLVNTSSSVLGLLPTVVVGRTATGGTPWQIEGAERWEFPGIGISQFMPLAFDTYGDDAQQMLPFQYGFYTDVVTDENQFPYRFVQDSAFGVGWHDVLNKFWEGHNVETAFCAVPLPATEQDGEITMVALHEPFAATLSVDAPTVFSVIVTVENEIFNSVLQVKVKDMAGDLLFTTEMATGYLEAGTHVLELDETWTPSAAAGSQLVTMIATADATDVIHESNEDDNEIEVEHPVSNTFNRPILTATIPHPFVTETSLPLQLSTSFSEITFARADVYQYDADGVSFLSELVFLDLDNPVLDLSNLVAGRVLVHVWAFTGNGPAQRHATLAFNYAPTTTLDVDERHDYVWEAQAGEAMNFHLETDASSDDIELCVGAPNNRWTMRCGSAVEVTDARSGDYRVAVFSRGQQVEYRLVADSSSRQAIVDDAQLTYRPLPSLREPVPCEFEHQNCGPRSAITGVQMDAQHGNMKPISLLVSVLLILTVVYMRVCQQARRHE